MSILTNLMYTKGNPNSIGPSVKNTKKPERPDLFTSLRTEPFMKVSGMLTVFSWMAKGC
jgi:hypothetical protein